MKSPYECQLRRDENGRIVEKTETVAGEPSVWTYAYATEGRLTEAKLDGLVVCQCFYDREGRRIRQRFPLTRGNGYQNFEYNRMNNRLTRAGDSSYTHDAQGFRSIWNDRGRYTTYKYAQDYRLLEVHKEAEGIRFSFEHDANGQRMAKYRDGRMVDAYKWLDLVRLAGFYDGSHVSEFAYQEGARVPFALRRDDGAEAFLFYDQVGSLRVVADTNGNVIKEVAYDPFGTIIRDTNPSLSIPIGFAGGLHDRDLGFVRFGWRDYDPATARWTAPDPMGDAGGDSDWYGYCLDDPVNSVDPLGLEGFGVEGYGYYDASWGGRRSSGKGATNEGKKSTTTTPKNTNTAGNPSGNSGQHVRDMEDRLTGDKTPQQIAQEMEKKAAEEEEKKDTWRDSMFTPELLRRKTDPAYRAARSLLGEKLQGFADGFLGLPDPYTTPFQAYGAYKKEKLGE